MPAAFVPEACYGGRAVVTELVVTLRTQSAPSSLFFPFRPQPPSRLSSETTVSGRAIFRQLLASNYLPPRKSHLHVLAVRMKPQEARTRGLDDNK